MNFIFYDDFPFGKENICHHSHSKFVLDCSVLSPTRINGEKLSKKSDIAQPQMTGAL